MAEIAPDRSAASIPPMAQLVEMMFGKAHTHLLFMAATLGVADLLKDGPKSVEYLAKVANANTDALARALRALAGTGVFAETEPGYFAQTPLSDLLRSDAPGSLRGMALMTGSDWHNRMWEHLLDSVRTGQSYFENKYRMDLYEYLRQHPADQDNLAAAMASLSGPDAAAVCTTYDFAGIQTLVDVGGGTGYFLANILKANPTLRGILFDQPAVAEQGRLHIKAEGLDNRCAVMSGDFFRSLPRGDAYTIKGVIFNWDDQRAGRILARCREAMNPGGRVLVIDPVIPPGNTPSPSRVLDMEMLVGCSGGRARTESEFETLFREAGLRLHRNLSMPSVYSIIEGIEA